VRLVSENLVIQTATLQDHAAIMRVAKQTPWTKDFGNQLRYSSPQNYERGWILVAKVPNLEATPGVYKVIGFACFRPKVRQPETTLYFVGVDPAARRRGIGWALIEHMMAQVVPPKLVLKCGKNNPDAKKFYDKHQFRTVGNDDDFWYMQRVF
jgi:ribosomal protein S18 acetylase RimI-like enzyme